MHKYMHEYGSAPESREAEARMLFPYRELSPEQYAAQEAHKWASFSFDDYIYKDAELNEWIHALGDILFAEGAVEAARRKYLTSAEIERIEQGQNESF